MQGAGVSNRAHRQNPPGSWAHPAKGPIVPVDLGNVRRGHVMQRGEWNSEGLFTISCSCGESFFGAVQEEVEREATEHFYPTKKEP